jgi:hypothetical protein
MFTSGANRLQYRPGTARSRWKVLERFGKGNERMDFKFVKRKERKVLENMNLERTPERGRPGGSPSDGSDLTSTKQRLLLGIIQCAENTLANKTRSSLLSTYSYGGFNLLAQARSFVSVQPASSNLTNTSRARNPCAPSRKPCRYLLTSCVQHTPTNFERHDATTIISFKSRTIHSPTIPKKPVPPFASLKHHRARIHGTRSLRR